MISGYNNPVLPGMNSDPSVCRVGDDFYLLTNSLTYFPGVPLYHSRDLLNWTLIGHCITRVSQADLNGLDCNSGLWASTLRHHDGRFYMVTTHMRGPRIFYVTADDPRGPWSDPVFVETSGYVYDPSLDFIDGKAFLGFTAGVGKNEMKLGEIDLVTGRWLVPPRTIWLGNGGFGAEGQHLYKIGNYYYLIDAEGGNINQAMNCARSLDPYGPYENCPHNPVVSNKENRAHLLQCIGHGDLIEHPDGSWWFLCHAVRNYGGFDELQTVLGREVVLLPVDWVDEWPVILGGQPVTRRIERAITAEVQAGPPSFADDFSSQCLNPEWSFLRHPAVDLCRVDAARPGLLLQGNAHTLAETEPLAFLGLRQNFSWGRVRVRWTFPAQQANEEAGLTFFMNQRYHFDCFTTRRADQLHLVVRRCADDLQVEVAALPLESPTVTVEVDTNPWAYEWFLVAADGERVPVAKAQNRMLSLHVAGGFIGVMIGLYASGNGQANREAARFDFIQYAPTPDLVENFKP
jgi:alpha-N-arabinofuranosidase